MAKDNINILKQWVNNLYLIPNNIDAAAEQFTVNGHVHITDFFVEKKATELSTKLKKATWKESYEPDLHKYCHAKITESFLQSAIFRTLLGKMLKTNGEKSTFEALQFGHGDYTLLHDKEHGKQGIFVWFDFTKDWQKDAGGMTVFTEEDKDPLLCVPTWNRFNAVHIKKQTGIFTKYVNCHAGKKKIILLKCWMKF